MRKRVKRDEARQHAAAFPESFCVISRVAYTCM